MYLARVPINRDDAIQVFIPDMIEPGMLDADRHTPRSGAIHRDANRGCFDIEFLSLLREPPKQEQMRKAFAIQVTIGRTVQVARQLIIDSRKVDTGSDEGRSTGLAGRLYRTSDPICEMGRCRIKPSRQRDRAEGYPRSPLHSA